MRAYLLRYGTKIYWRLRLAKHRLPVEAPVRVIKNRTYRHWLRKSYTLDVHRPDTAATNLPVLVYVHGGGWIMGDKFERNDLCKRLAAQNFVVLNINYRLSPEFRFPAAAIDTLRAMEWAKKHAAEYGGDPSNISLIGDSSGAHIAAVAACAATHPELCRAWKMRFTPTVRAKRIVLYYGLYNLRSALEVKRKYFKTYLRSYVGTSKFLSYKLLDYFSPSDYVTADYPQALLMASEADPLCDQTIEFADKLGAVGASANLLLLEKSDYPNALHGFVIDAATPAAQRVFEATCDFLHQN